MRASYDEGLEESGEMMQEGPGSGMAWLERINAKRAEILRDTEELNDAQVRRSHALYDEDDEEAEEDDDGVPKRVRVVDGRLDMSKRELTTAAVLPRHIDAAALQTVHTLVVRGNRLRALDARLLLPLKSLRWLDVSHNELERVLPFGAAANFTSSKCANLTDQGHPMSSAADLVCYGGLPPVLEVLDASHNRISRLSLGTLGAACLERLNVASNKIRFVSGDFKSPSLVELDLRRNEIRDISQLKCLGSLRRLQRLLLGSNPVAKDPRYKLKLNAISHHLLSALDAPPLPHASKPPPPTTTSAAGTRSSPSKRIIPSVLLSTQSAAVEMASTERHAVRSVWTPQPDYAAKYAAAAAAAARGKAHAAPKPRDPLPIFFKQQQQQRPPAESVGTRSPSPLTTRDNSPATSPQPPTLPPPDDEKEQEESVAPSETTPAAAPVIAKLGDDRSVAASSVAKSSSSSKRASTAQSSEQEDDDASETATESTEATTATTRSEVNNGVSFRERLRMAAQAKSSSEEQETASTVVEEEEEQEEEEDSADVEEGSADVEEASLKSGESSLAVSSQPSKRLVDDEDLTSRVDLGLSSQPTVVDDEALTSRADLGLAASTFGGGGTDFSKPPLEEAEDFGGLEEEDDDDESSEEEDDDDETATVDTAVDSTVDTRASGKPATTIPSFRDRLRNAAETTNRRNSSSTSSSSSSAPPTAASESDDDETATTATGTLYSESGPDWIEGWDGNYKHVYYFNIQTEHTSWEVPAHAEFRPMSDKDQARRRADTAN